MFSGVFPHFVFIKLLDIILVPEGESLDWGNTHLYIWMIKTKFRVASLSPHTLVKSVLHLMKFAWRSSNALHGHHLVAVDRHPSAASVSRQVERRAQEVCWARDQSAKTADNKAARSWKKIASRVCEKSARSTRNPWRMEMSANTTWTVQKPMCIVAFWNVQTQSALPSRSKGNCSVLLNSSMFLYQNRDTMLIVW